MEAEGPPQCLPPPGLGPAHLTQDVAPAAHPWGPNKDIQLHKQPCPPAHILPAPATHHTLMVPGPLFSRSIRCLRNIIHWNLITAFILRNATWFVVQFTMNPEVHESNVVGAAMSGSWPEPGPSVWGVWGA